MTHRLQKGDLVRLIPSKDPLIHKVFNLPEEIYGVVVQCRYKRDIYLFSPANNPIVTSPYWVEGQHLERVDDV